LRRNRFGLRAFDAEIEAHQQMVADESLKLNLIPRPITIAEARWSPPETPIPPPAGKGSGVVVRSESGRPAPPPG
jgi:hypothetical protein